MFEADLLKDKNIIITGGGTGLGKSMGMRFGELGAKIVITSRKQDVLDETAREMESVGISVLPIAGDVRNPEEVDRVVQKAKESFGPIDGLVNNAAGNFISPTENLTPGGFKAVTDIVLGGTFNFTLSTGKEMIQSESGCILNIVTTYAWTGSGYVVPSAAAKGGVLAMTRSLGSEWGKYGIRTNAIAPGPFPTKGAWNRLFPKPISTFFNFEKTLPMKRYGNHQELANLAAYMISDYAGYLNGEVVTLDGGEWIYNAGQFNKLEKVPKKAWSLIERAVRGKKKK